MKKPIEVGMKVEWIERTGAHWMPNQTDKQFSAVETVKQGRVIAVHQGSNCFLIATPQHPTGSDAIHRCQITKVWRKRERLERDVVPLVVTEKRGMETHYRVNIGAHFDDLKPFAGKRCRLKLEVLK